MRIIINGKNWEESKMFGNIHIINPAAIDFLLEEIEQDRFAELSSRDFRIKERKTRPLRGFEHQENYPWCCKNHRKMLSDLQEQFLKFPDCCPKHQRLKKAGWFNKADYFYVPIKCMNTYAYTCHCIDTNLNEKDWLKRITDYFDYTIKSFGQFPDGYGAPIGAGTYVQYVQNYLEKSKEIPSWKKNKLLEWFVDLEQGSACDEMVDLNLLMTRYKEWLKIFPFDLSIFKSIKNYFYKRMPVLKKINTPNMYTGLVSSQLLSYKEFMDFLVATTKKIIYHINLAVLYKQNNLPAADALTIEMAVANREIDLLKYDGKLSNDTITYRSVISDWLKEEKEFLKEITPALQRKQDTQSFAENIIDGIQALQWEEEAAPYLMNLRNDGPEKEEGIRNFFRIWMKGRYPGAHISSEDKRGKRYIDLMISQEIIGQKIMEFKGWWNQSKTALPEQISGYLTDGHSEGYILMINDNKTKSIDLEYREIITSSDMKFLPESWREYPIPGTQLMYYSSDHKFGIHVKTIFHFILNAHF